MSLIRWFEAYLSDLIRQGPHHVLKRDQFKFATHLPFLVRVCTGTPSRHS